MTPLPRRKEVGLDQKLKALDAEFDHWLGLSAANHAFEKHQTQVIALTGHLKGLRRSTEEIFVVSALGQKQTSVPIAEIRFTPRSPCPRARLACWGYLGQAPLQF